MFYLYDALGRFTGKGNVRERTPLQVRWYTYRTSTTIMTFCRNRDSPTVLWFPAATVQDKSNARNHQTGSILSLLDGTGKVYVANYYDVKGEGDTYHPFAAGLLPQAGDCLTFTGNPQTVNEWHYKNGTPTVSGKYTYTYDTCDRPESVKFDLNHSGTSITLAAYTYDKFGRLQSQGVPWRKCRQADLRLQPPWLADGHQRNEVRPESVLQHRHRCCQVQRQHQQHDVESRE